MRMRAPFVLLAAVLAVPVLSPTPPARGDADPGRSPASWRGSRLLLEEAALPPAVRERLSWSVDARPLARQLGLRTLFGRQLDEQSPTPAGRSDPLVDAHGHGGHGHGGHGKPGPSPTDVAIAADPVVSASRPSVAARPGRSRLIVSAYLAYPYSTAPDVRCATSRSDDGGQSFSAAVFLPQLAPSSTCGDPVLAWAADGRSLFAAYLDYKTGTEVLTPGPGEILRYRVFGDIDVVVSRSNDGGRIWSAPVVALDGDPWAYTVSCKGTFPCDTEDVDPGWSFEPPAIATPLHGGCDSLYVTSTRVAEQDPSLPPTAIAFTRYRGAAFSAPEILDTGADAPLPITVMGANVAGGRSGEVLVAWYDSGDDGMFEGAFEIRVRASRDGGRTWQPVVVAARDAYETGRDLGPLAFYKQWWPTMFPDVALDRFGRAHLVYTHDPEEGSLTAEEGDVRYVTSPCPPWNDWSSPVTVNDDGPGRAQGFASLAVRDGEHGTSVDVVWEDTRTSPDLPIDPTTLSSPNLYYDLFHARWQGTKRGGSWSTNERVSTVSSLQDRATAGWRTGLTGNHWLLFAVWTDRRAEVAVRDTHQDVYGRAIVPVPACWRGPRYRTNDSRRDAADKGIR
jgi:hypothetical protein